VNPGCPKSVSRASDSSGVYWLGGCRLEGARILRAWKQEGDRDARRSPASTLYGTTLGLRAPGPVSAWSTQLTSTELSPGSNTGLLGFAHSRSSKNPSEGRRSEGFRQGDGLRISSGLCRESPDS
jgi:hypothetical protein